MSPEVKQAVQKHGEDLTGEHKLGDAGQLIIAVLFLVVWIMDSFFLKYTTFLNNYVPLTVQIILSVVMLLIAYYLARAGMKIVFKEVRETPGVINKGVFAVIRHPIYLSEILFYLALILLRTSLAAVFIWILAIIFLYYISHFEEKLLLARFGDKYRQYMKDVSMFIPKIHRRRIKQTD